MAGGKSAWLANKLIEHVLGGSSYTPSTTVWVALSGNLWTATATGSNLGEIATSSYARVSLSNDSTTFTTATSGSPSVKLNQIVITFPTATEDWGEIKSVYLIDAASGGNCLYGADYPGAPPQNVVVNGATFTIQPSQFAFSEA